MVKMASAHFEVSMAVKEGKLTKPNKCSICGREYEYPRRFIVGHHDDYNKPFEVRWMCKKCHFKLHSMQRIATNKKIKADGGKEVHQRHVFKYSLTYINK
jgi:ribosomal protein S27AE